MGGKICRCAQEGERREQRGAFGGDYEAEAEEIKGAGGGGKGRSVWLCCPVPQRITDVLVRRYGGYNEDMINRFVMMGFDLDRVVAAFDYVGIDPNGGEDYELEEAYIGDITARLLGEP